MSTDTKLVAIGGGSASIPLDTDATLAGNSDNRVATQKAAKAYIDASVSVAGGVTASAAELNYNDITTLGTGAASKAVVLDAGEDYTWPATGILTYGVLKDSAGTTLTATAAQLNRTAVTTPGTQEASKVIVNDANVNQGAVKATSLAIGASGSEVALGSTPAEINAYTDVSAMGQTLTASGAITAGKRCVMLNHTTVAIAATIADASLFPGVFCIKATTEPGAGQDHTCTITTGTWNGTNKIATFADIGDQLIVFFDTAGNGTVLVNTGSVGFSG